MNLVLHFSAYASELPMCRSD